MGTVGRSSASWLSSPPFAARAACFGLAYLAGALIGDVLTHRDGAFITFWLPSGLFLAALLAAETRRWPVLIAVAIVANLGFDLWNGQPAIVAAGFTAGNAIEALAGAWLVRRFVAERPRFSSLQQTAGVFLAAAASCALSAAVGAGLTAWRLGGAGFADNWLRWWGGDILAVLLVTPLILGSAAAWPRRSRAGRLGRVMEAAALAAALAHGTWMIFSSGLGFRSPWKSLLTPFLLWAALRFGMRAGAAATLAVSVMAIWLSGPAAGDQLALGQLFLAAACLIWLLPASLMAERKKAETTLRERESRFRAIFEQAGAGVALIETATGRFLSVNQKYCEITGLTAAQMTATTFGAITHPDDQTAGLDNLRRLRAGEIPGFTMEKRYLRPDGGIVWVELSVSPLWAAGEIPDYHITVAIDITARKLAEEALRKERGILNAVMQSTDVMLVYLDRDFNFVAVNSAYAEGCRRRPQELIGRNHFESFPHDENEAIFRLVRDTGQAAFFRDRPFVFPDQPERGTTYWDWSLIAVKGQSDLVQGLVLSLRETTEHKRLEERLHRSQKAESIGRLVGGVAHDFNNLLTPIQGYAQLLERRAEGREREMLGSILRASQTLSELTRQLLAYAGKGQMIVQRVDVAHSVWEMCELLRASIPKNADLRLAASAGPATVDADPGQVQQIVVNLVLNAAEAIGPDAPGKVTIAVRAQEVAASAVEDELTGDFLPAGDYVTIEVTDTGCGIDEGTRRKLFDPFFTTKFTGRGLGLAAVAGITRSLRGGVRIESIPGFGSTFQVFLPAAPEELPDVPPAGNVEVRAAGTILVVDDEPMVLDLLEEVLREGGFEVLRARTGAEALEIFDRHSGRIGAVLLDLTMPLLSGRDTYEELRRKRGDLRVLLMSGYSEEEALRLFGSRSGVAFVQKPLDLAELLSKVREVLVS